MARADSIGFFWEDRPAVKPEKVEKPKRTPPERTWERPDYLPGLEEARAFRVSQFEDWELAIACAKREKFIFDIECYSNYFLVAFTSLASGKVIYFERTANHDFNTPKLKWIVDTFCLVGFNSWNYDIPILALALAGKNNAQLKQATNDIIVNQMRGSDVLRAAKVKKITPNHIDLIEVAPLRASLKIYGGRLHTPRMQDLPFHPETILSPEQMDIVRWYCVNDLANTAFLHQSLEEQLALREVMSQEYGVDLRSKSDAQIAEAVIANELERLNGRRSQRPEIAPGTCYKYQVPKFLKYESPLMNWALNIVQNANFVVSEDGAIGMPAELKELELQIANGVYRMGIGGLHSSEQCAGHVATDEIEIRDIDVESFYPRIILNLGLYPKHLGPAFLKVYSDIVDRRIRAKDGAKRIKALLKQDGLTEDVKVRYNKELGVLEVTSDSLKITINGSFGKLGSKYSVLYAPDLLIQVTVTGQLSLLMLIERMELAGVSVVSANTDGIVLKYLKSRKADVDAIIAQWEKETQFKMESTFYSAIYSRDVNNYIAVKYDGDVKTKGAYSSPKKAAGRLHKNPTNEICVDAVTALLTKGAPIVTTVQACKDVRKFVSVRTVKGGAVKVWKKTDLPAHTSEEELVHLAGFYPAEGVGNYRHPSYGENLAVFTLASAYREARAMLQKPEKVEFLGKSIRWYYAAGEQGELVYADSGNKVPRSEGATPLMDMPETFPQDIDYEWYIAEAEKMLVAIGYTPKEVVQN